MKKDRPYAEFMKEWREKRSKAVRALEGRGIPTLEQMEKQLLEHSRTPNVYSPQK